MNCQSLHRLGGHLSSTVTTKSRFTSMECHSPGPIFRTPSFSHSCSWAKLGKFRAAAFRTPNHFPSSPRAMQGISRKTLSIFRFNLIMFTSASKLEAHITPPANYKYSSAPTSSFLQLLSWIKWTASWEHWGSSVWQDTASSAATSQDWVKMVTSLAMVGRPRHKTFMFGIVKFPFVAPNTPGSECQGQYIGFAYDHGCPVRAPYSLSRIALESLSSEAFLADRSCVSMNIFLRPKVFTNLHVKST